MVFTKSEAPRVTLSVMQTDVLKPHLSKVPEAPKKTVPEKKIPAAVPKKEKVPPAKGILALFYSFLHNVCLFHRNWYVLQICITLTGKRVPVFKIFHVVCLIVLLDIF